MSHKITAQIKKQFKTGSATELSSIVDFRIKGVKNHDRLWKIAYENQSETDNSIYDRVVRRS